MPLCIDYLIYFLLTRIVVRQKADESKVPKKALGSELTRPHLFL